MSLITDLETLLKPPIERLGATLESVGLSLEHGEHILHVAVSRPDGPVDLGFIVKVSETINPLLDASNLIDHRYMLDVSSAGAERMIALEDLPKHIGAYVNVKLRKPLRGENDLEATLEEANAETITIAGRRKSQSYRQQISIADIDKVRLAIKF